MSGLHAYTLREYAVTWRALGVVRSVHWNRAPIDSQVDDSALAIAPGTGRSQLAGELVLSSLATKIVLPLRARRTKFGYPPVGIEPKGTLPPGYFTLTTAESLAFAIHKINSPRDRARERVCPASALGSIAVPIISIGLAVLAQGFWESWRERILRGRIDQVVTAELSRSGPRGVETDGKVQRGARV